MVKPILSYKSKSYLTVLGTSLIYFAMGLYFAAGNTGVYLTSYLIYRSNSDMKLDDAIWFLSAAGFSALLLPMGGWLEGKLGVRGVCLVGGLLQTCGIFATYYALDTTFFWVVFVYGGSFLVSLASCYTSPMVNVCKWHPKHRGLVTGIGAASMALAPTLFTPLITALVNPNNLPPNELGLFDDDDILDRTKSSTIIQAAITASLFLVGILLTFPAERQPEPEPEAPKKHWPRRVDEKQEQPQPVALISYCDLKEGTGPATKGDEQRRGDAGLVGTTPPQAQVHGHKQYEAASTKQPALHQDHHHHDYSLEPRFAFRTPEFWLLSLKVLISELIFIYLLFMYKPYGQTFIQDDYFLSSVGAACAISNTVGRLTMGHVKDKLGYKAVSIPLSATTMLSVALMPLTRHMNKLYYGVSVVVAVGAVGSQYALMPSAAQDSFGDKYASINIGFVYMSTVVATVSSALLSQNLTTMIGWDGMIVLIASCAALDFVSTFFMPADPRRRLLERCRQFYGENKPDDNKLQCTSVAVSAA
jgi:MFS family permease